MTLRPQATSGILPSSKSFNEHATVVAGDWVFAVGTDPDHATPITPVSGQTVLHQFSDGAATDTDWVQSTTAPSTLNGIVQIHDSTPTTDHWNYAAVEIVATHQ